MTKQQKSLVFIVAILAAVTSIVLAMCALETMSVWFSGGSILSLFTCFYLFDKADSL